MKPKPAIRHAGGTIRREPSGRYIATYCHAGQRFRKRHFNLEHLKGWIENTRQRCLSQNAPLTPRQEAAAREALQLLDTLQSAGEPDQGIPDPGPELLLIEAARHYARLRAGNHHRLTLADAIQRYHLERTHVGLSERTLLESRKLLGRFERALGDQPLILLTPAQITDYLDAHQMTAQHRKNNRAVIRALCAWAVRAGLLERNPADAVPCPRIPAPVPAILTPDQLRALLEAAQPHLWPAIALGAFCGIRPDEIRRLQWGHIRPDYIHIGAYQAKMSVQRYVTLHPTCAAWLRAALQRQAVPGLPGPVDQDPDTTDLIDATSLLPALAAARVAPVTAGRQIPRAARSIGIHPWPQDVLRHSFASYHLALGRSAPDTAHEMGHRGTHLLFERYRHLTTPEQARRWFSTLP